MKRLCEFLSGIPATAVGGVCLLLSLLLPRVGVALPVDPAWVTVGISGIPLLSLAVSRLVRLPGIRKISSALLISVAMVASIAIGDLFAAGEVAFIMALGEILEDLTTARARRGLRKLIALAPIEGRRVTERGEERIPVEEIACGDLLRILPGETVPADGVIVSGESSLDQSVMTGESLPVDKTVGDEVFCGTVNRFGAIDIRATRAPEDSSLERMIRLVREAEEKKAPIERIADRAAALLVPVALLIALLSGLITRDITRAVTVLVVFCPCGLVLATPTAVMAAIGQATRHGVIVKSGEALERMGRVDTLALDKTGTLTSARLGVTDVIPLAEGIGREGLLSLVAAAEARSEHPIGKAIVAYAEECGIGYPEPEQFGMEAGRGVSATVGAKRLLCGNERLLAEHGILPDGEAAAALEGLRAEGKASVLVAEGCRCIGILGLSDTVRPEAADTVARLGQMQLDTVLLTGDSREAAAHLAAGVGIREVRAGLLPGQKLEAVEALRSEGRTVAMIGDGVNDAAALKAADVGIAMGGIGSDIAVEAADIVLMSDDLTRLPYLKRLAASTARTVRGGIALSMLINLAAVTLSVLGLLTPTTGALVHNAGSLLVVLIAALLYDRRFE